MSHVVTFLNLNFIDDKIYQKIRDVKIQTTWVAMRTWTKLSYKAKIQVLMDEYHLGFKRIEDIIKGF